MRKIAIRSKYATRRQAINAEYTRQLIGVIAAAVMLLAIFVLGIYSCAVRSGCGPQPEVEPTETPIEELVREPIDVTTYPRLVDNAHLLEAGYVPPGLTRLLGMPDGSENMMEFEAATAYAELYDAMLADGMAIIPLSAYRTYDEQASIFNWNLELHVSEGMEVDEAREYTERFVAIPGASEHQYGRSIDVTIDGTTNHEFHETEQGKWLIEHAHEFGFIIRYPEDKADITGISYEPWHLRYVGVVHAEYIHRYDLCLEEYITLVREDCPWATSE